MNGNAWSLSLYLPTDARPTLLCYIVAVSGSALLRAIVINRVCHGLYCLLYGKFLYRVQVQLNGALLMVRTPFPHVADI